MQGPYQVQAQPAQEKHADTNGGPALKQLSFNCNDPEKYVEQLNLKIEVTNILQTKMYDVTEEEKVPIMETC